MKIKQVNMTNLDFIKKWIETDHEEVTVIFLDGEEVTEIDEEDRKVYTDQGTISFDDLEQYNVWVNEVYDVDLDTDIKEFLKDVRNAKKFASKQFYGRGMVFIDNSGEYYNENRLEYFGDLNEIFEAFERNLELKEMVTIEENKTSI